MNSVDGVEPRVGPVVDVVRAHRRPDDQRPEEAHPDLDLGAGVQAGVPLVFWPPPLSYR